MSDISTINSSNDDIGPHAIDPIDINADKEYNLPTSPIYNAITQSDFKSEDYEEPNKNISIWRKYLHTLRPDYFLDHLDYDSFKIVTQTFIQVWASVFLSIVPKTSHWIGNAAYLMQIMGFIASCGGQPIYINTTVSIGCVLYCLAAWLHCVIAMAITSRIRGWKPPEYYIAELINEGICTEENGLNCFIDVVFTGRYLQTKCTGVWVMCLIVGLTIFGLSEKIHPLMRLPFVTAAITIIINVAYGVMIPCFLPKLIGLSILKPMCISYAFKIVVGFLIFPCTANWKYVKGSIGILKGLSKINKGNIMFLESMKPSGDNFSKFSKLTNDIASIRVKAPALDLFAKCSAYELSFGRLDAGDIGQFRSHLKNLISISASYEYFYQLFQERVDVASNTFKDLKRRGTVSSQSYSTGHNKLLSTIKHSYKEVGNYESKRRTELLARNFNNGQKKVTMADLDRIAEIIKSDFKSIIDSTDIALDAIIDWLESANNFRTFSLVSPSIYKKRVSKQQESNKKITEAKNYIEEQMRLAIDVDQLKQRVTKSVKNEESLLTFISQTNLLIHIIKEHCKELISIMELFINIDERRPKPKLISFITKMRYEKLQNSSTKLSHGEDPSKVSLKLIAPQITSRDPDAYPPSSNFQLLGKHYRTFYNEILMNEHIWFWIRVGGLTNICCLPYYCRTTAAWYYSSRLIWLPITCGVSTSEYTAETVYIFMCKIIYSFFGSLSGLVGWYISTGKGNGNYYGYAIVTGFLYFYLCYYRHFSIHLTTMPSVMTSVTPTLVLGTSWVDAKYNKLANIGTGLRVAITRYVSVVIGLCLAFLASTFPRPNSSKKAVRVSIANSIEEIGNLHCNITNFAIDRFKNPHLHASERHDIIINKFRNILLSLAKVNTAVKPIQYEISIYGDWPTERYKRLQVLVNDIIQLYYLVFSIIDQVQDPKEWMKHIINRAGWTDSDLTADIFSIVHMTSGSLRTKDALPKITQANISIKHMDILREQWGIPMTSLSERFYNDSASFENNLVDATEELHESIMQNIDFSKLFSHDGQLNIVVLLLSHLIYKRIDEVVITVKGLVGEKYDFEEELFLNTQDI